MPGPILDPNKAQSLSEGFKGNTGLMGLKKMFGQGNDESPMQLALNKRAAKLQEMKENAGSNSQY